MNKKTVTLTVQLDLDPTEGPMDTPEGATTILRSVLRNYNPRVELVRESPELKSPELLNQVLDDDRLLDLRERREILLGALDALQRQKECVRHEARGNDPALETVGPKDRSFVLAPVYSAQAATIEALSFVEEDIATLLREKELS